MSTLSEQLGALAASSTSSPSSSSSSSSGAAAVTLLHANAHGSSARSIPLSTLRENAIVAYESLVLSSSTSSSSSSTTAMAEELLSARNLTTFERGTANRELNMQMDVTLDSFLSWLALHLAAAAVAACDDTFTSSTTSANTTGAIVIIEYLLRLYELHTRPSTACALLTALLPLLATTTTTTTAAASASTTSLSTSSTSSIFFTHAATLIEVAGIGLDHVTPAGCWSFLRPYIVAKTNGGIRGGGGGGGGGGMMMMINQKILAIQCAKNDAFAYQIITNKLSIIASEYIQQQQQQQQQSTTTLYNTSMNVGASAILSFTASILVESLYLQMTSPNNNGGGNEGGGGGGGVRESTVRALLPTILDACRHYSSCQVVSGERTFSSNSNSNNNSNNSNFNNNELEQWKGWGYILLSTIVTTCPSLGHTAKVAMCDAIVDGLVGSVKTKKRGSSSSKTKATKSITFHEVSSLTTIDSSNEYDNDACCGAILTLITVLGTMNTTTTTITDDTNEDEWLYYLPLLPPKMRKKSTIIDYLGCELPISTYKRLSKLQYGFVASAISLAMHVVTTEDDDDAQVVMIKMEKIAPLVATLIMHAFYKLYCDSKKMLTLNPTTVKSTNDDEDNDYNIKCKADRDVLLILGLVSCLYFVLSCCHNFVYLIFFYYCTPSPSLQNKRFDIHLSCHYGRLIVHPWLQQQLFMQFPHMIGCCFIIMMIS